LEKAKKLIAVMLLCMTAVFSLYSQSNSTQNSTSLSEEYIVLTDDTLTDGTSSTQTYKGPSTVGMFIRMIVVLIIVVGLIYGVLWFIKKKTNVVKTDDEYLRRAAYINIAPGKTIEVITLIDKAYLIGVTEDNITMLGEIQDDELIKAMNLTADKKNNTKKPTTFADVLDMFLVKKSGQKSVFTDEEQQVDQMFNNGNAGDNGEEKNEV
jgi:flagellar protein FliO/FliZ